MWARRSTPLAPKRGDLDKLGLTDRQIGLTKQHQVRVCVTRAARAATPESAYFF
jgi:hypothetical protein